MQTWSVVWSGESRADSCASAEVPHVNILGPWYSNVDPSRGVQERVGGGGILSRRGRESSRRGMAVREKRLVIHPKPQPFNLKPQNPDL